MQVKASLRYLRISPRKVRLVTQLIKGLSAKEAESQLFFNPKRSGKDILKLLKSAIANAEHNFQLNKEKLFVREIRVDEGPAFKRIMPRARGAAYPIRKRTSHISIVLEEKEDLKPKIITKEEKAELKEKVKREKIRKKFEQKKEKYFEKEKIEKRATVRQKLFRRKVI